MSEDITKEQERIGGDWAVAQAVPTREVRDRIRSQMGPNLIFVVLHMSKEDQTARIKERHGEEENMIAMLTKMYDAYEIAAADEVTVNVTPVVAVVEINAESALMQWFDANRITMGENSMVILNDIGVEDTNDLLELDHDDLELICSSMKKIQAKRFKAAIKEL